MLPASLPPASGGTWRAPVASTGHGIPERLRSGDFSTRCKRLCFTPGSKEVVYERRKGHDAEELAEDERIDAEEFVARVLVQIPDPRRHLVRYYGAYSNRARGQRRKAEGPARGPSLQ